MPDILLEGCASRPLASCLKALGILRLVGEQQDAQVRGAWRNGCFVLSSSLDKETLCDFFLHVWQPTPLVSPWNGGSGFYPKKEEEINGLKLLLQVQNPRLAAYQAVIARIRDWPEFRMLASLPAGQARKQRDSVIKTCKDTFLQRCRAELPEACLPWLDAAFILREDKAVFAPLLRTGGNEGNLEYANNFMQHVSRVFSSDARQNRDWLEASLFASPVNRLPIMATGQFDPGRAGGRNQGRGFFVEKAPVNPWDFILMLEGTLLFAGTLARRSPEDPAQVSFPFCVTNLSAGYASSALQNNVGGELWFPLWSRPASLREVRRLLGEGRATLGRRQACDGLDFTRAIASLGVERGIGSFERYSFQERRGKGYYVALPSGNLSVRYQPRVALLEPVARWLEQRCLNKEEPATLTSARRRLAAAVFACARTPDARHFQAVSRALAHMDALPTLPAQLRAPCPGLAADWIAACDDGGPEVRLAAALASSGGAGKLGPLRAQLAPVSPAAPFRWEKDSEQFSAWRGATLEGIGNLFLRRLLLAQRYGVSPLHAGVRLQPADLLPLLQETLDMALLQDLLRAFSLIRWPKTMQSLWPQPLQAQRLPHAFTLLQLLYTPLPTDCGLDRERLCPDLRIARLVQAQRLEEACTLAAQRLRVAGGGALYLPASFVESVRGLSPAAVLTCLAVPVSPHALLRQCHQSSC